MKRVSQRGFSLIEVMTVMAVILTVAAMSVPPLLRARSNANEAAAAINLRTLQEAQATYSLIHPDRGYSCSLKDLNLERLGFTIGSKGVQKNGYLYEVRRCDGLSSRSTSYVIAAVSEFGAAAGTTYACAKDDGMVYYANRNEGVACVAESTPLVSKDTSHQSPDFSADQSAAAK